ncbi:nicotinamide N-methyltransferase-like [Pseudophryne corroboree]|uniref:nicotinamide N-methyltransferase-like n=1 Tax=Pseudophryne corroboree TaxID=495146 RepID=UPI0030816ED2
MDPSSPKKYHMHEFNPLALLDAYFSPKADAHLFQESTTNIMQVLHKAFTSGYVTGKTLIDISPGPIIFQLLAICEFLEEITVLEFHDFCIKELEKWMNKEAEAFDWTHALTFMTGLKGSSDGWDEREDMMRRKLKRIVKCDFSKDNPTDPLVLPKVDCVMSLWVLDIISKDHDTYCTNLKKISSLIKLGGYLLLCGDINASYVTIGEHKYHFLTYDDKFLRKALSDEGYSIEHYEELERKTTSDLVDHDKVVFVIARKVKEV